MKTLVFPPPADIPVPTFDPTDIKGSTERENQFIAKIQAFCKEHSIDEPWKRQYVGEIYRIPMGDGYAQYVVFALTTVILVHLPVGDAYDSPRASEAKPEQIRQYIDGQRAQARRSAEKNDAANQTTPSH